MMNALVAYLEQLRVFGRDGWEAWKLSDGKRQRDTPWTVYVVYLKAEY